MTEQNEGTQNLTGLRYVKQNLPVHLHSFAPLIVVMVNSRLEWLMGEDREEALLYGIALLNQAWEDRETRFGNAQFRRFAALRMHRLIDMFRSEITERQHGNKQHWSQKNDRSQHRDQEWQEIRAQIQRRRRHSLPISSGAYRSSRALAGRLQLPTEEQQITLEEGYGLESVTITYFASNSDSINGVSQVRYDRRLISAMRPVDKLRLLLPKRERALLRQLESGMSLADLCREWDISRARGTQLEQKTMERLKRYLCRLVDGEEYSTLLAEAEVTNGPINRCSRTLTKPAKNIFTEEAATS